MNRLTPTLLGSLVLLPTLVVAQGAPPPTGAGLPRTWSGPPTTAEITPRDLMTRLYIFADDSMQGRAAGTVGHHRATTWLAAELEKIGLEPAGDDGTFFQNVPLRTVTGSANLKVDGVPITMGTDFLMLPENLIEGYGGRIAGPDTPTIFGGRLGAPNAISPADAAGKLVVFLPPIAGNGQASFAFWAHPQIGQYADAAGFLVAALDIFPPQFASFLTDESTGYFPGDLPQAGQVGMLVSPSVAVRIVGRPLEQALPGALGKPLGGTAGYEYRHTEAPARNVVGLLRGSDPTLSTEYVLVGAHSDHTGLQDEIVDHDSLRVYNTVVRPRGVEDGEVEATAEQIPRIRQMLDSVRALRPGRLDSIANGADDDGSGSVALLEVAQAMAAAPDRPRRSILFIWHVAEELGLFGSEHFSDHPTVPRDSIVAAINVDMVGRGGESDLPNGGPGYLQLIGSRRLSTELGDLVETRNTEGRFGFRFDYQFDANNHPDQYYCRSDHYNYARYGIPVVFMSTGGHRDYHIVTDEPQYIDYDQLARVSRFIEDLARTVANLGHRVVVDKPKPDPAAPCVQ